MLENNNLYVSFLVSQRLSQTAMNNGNSASYRSQSPEVDSPSSRGHGSHDIRDRDHRGSDRFSYMQKMRDRDRDVYKKDKYSTGELNVKFTRVTYKLVRLIKVV